MERMSGPGTTDTPVYALHGLRLRSPVPLAGFPASAGPNDVDVRWSEGKPVPDEPPAGRVGAALELHGSYRYVAAAGDDGSWTLRVPGMCDFVVATGRKTVECRLDPSADPDFVALLVSGLLASFLLGLEGHLVLHASAVELENRALAVAGPSGAGKSTLAALLCGAGARLVTDDVLRVGLRPEVVCVGGSPHLRLRPRATWVLDDFPARPPTGVTVDARLAVELTTSSTDVVPLLAVVLPLLSREATTVELRPQTGAASVSRLAAAARVAGWTDPDVARSQFRTMARVAAAVPVIEAVIPWQPASHALVAPALLDVLTAATTPSPSTRAP